MRSQRKRYVHRTVLLSLTAALVVGQPMAALAAPDNDDRANATPVTAIPFSDVVDVSDATVEDDEPGTGCLTYYDDEFDETYEVPVGHTVWYEVSLRNRAPRCSSTPRAPGSTPWRSSTTATSRRSPATTTPARCRPRSTSPPSAGRPTWSRSARSATTSTRSTRTRRWWSRSPAGACRPVRSTQPAGALLLPGPAGGAYDWWESEDGTSFRTEGVGIVQGRQQDSWSRGNNRIAEVYVYSYEVERDLEKDTRPSPTGGATNSSATVGSTVVCATRTSTRTSGSRATAAPARSWTGTRARRGRGGRVLLHRAR
jgi:hypothetical protein